MDHLVESGGSEEIIDSRPVTKVAFDKTKSRRALQFLQISFLAGRGVKIVQIIVGGNFVSLTEKTFAKVRSDKTGPAGHEKIHPADK